MAAPAAPAVRLRSAAALAEADGERDQAEVATLGRFAAAIYNHTLKGAEGEGPAPQPGTGAVLMRGLGLTWAERKKAAQELKTHAAERAHDHANELAKLLNDAAMRDAQGAIRVLLAINGGAAAALLAFTAGLMGRSSSQISTVPLSSIAAVVANLKWFGWGVICSAVAAVLAYLTNVSIATAAGVRPRSWQYPYVHASRPAKTWLLAGRIFQVLGMSAGIAALVFFVYGLYKVQQRVGIIFAGT